MGCRCQRPFSARGHPGCENATPRAAPRPAEEPRNMPAKDRNWHTERRRSRVFDRLGTNPAGRRMFRAAANGSWSGCWAQTSRFGASRFVPKIAKNGRIFEKIPRRPGLCCPTCPDPDRGKREGPSTSALRPQQARDTWAGRFPVVAHHHLNGSRRRMRAALVKNSVLALAPAQIGSRLAGSGPTDGCATAFSPLPPQMRPSQPSLRGQPAQSARLPRWSAPATGHCRRVCGGGVPPAGIGDS